MKSVSISEVCRLLGTSRQRYYRGVWGERRSRRRATEAVALVQSVRKEMPRIGGRKLHHMLGRELGGIGVGRDRLFDILRANHMLVLPKKSYRTTTNSRHKFRKYKNLIAGMPVTGPEQVWVSDITYTANRAGRASFARRNSVNIAAYSSQLPSETLSSAECAPSPFAANIATGMPRCT